MLELHKLGTDKLTCHYPSDTPKRRYLVTPNAEQADYTMRLTMQRMLELNEDQAYSYSREELVALLDELLKTNP